MDSTESLRLFAFRVYERIEEILDECGWELNTREHAVELLTAWAGNDLAHREWAELVEPLVRDLRRTPDAMMALRNFDRYARAVGSHAPLFRRLLLDEPRREYLVELFSLSQFFADIAVRNPEYIEWCFGAAEAAQGPKPRERFVEELKGFVRPFRSREARRKALCRYKRRELLRMGIRDLVAKAPLSDFCLELTYLAEAATKLAFDDCFEDAVSKYGRPAVSKDEIDSGFAVVAMGKLGGGELNFSSDIDLVFVYDIEGKTTGVDDGISGPKNALGNHEFYGRLATDLSSYLHDPTDEGMIYRVDTRLRPDGISGSMARSLQSYSSYFVDYARSWEKISYSKARCIAGDELVARRFDRLATSFIYSNNDPSVLLPEVARLKRRIDFESLDENGRINDIKRGTGGIREIEFVIGGLQILNGTSDRQFRIRSSLDSLAKLTEQGKIDPETSKKLEDIYWFFRRVEHVLQMMNEQQTQLMPSDPFERMQLARRSGWNDVEAFEEELTSTRQFVREEFEELFHDSQQERMSLADKLESGEPPDEKALDMLRPYGMASSAGFNALRELATGTLEWALRSSGQREFEKFLPDLLEAYKIVPYPIQGTGSFCNFMRAHKGVSALYNLLSNHKPLVRLLMRSLGYGSMPARILIAHPELFDELVEGGGLTPFRDPQDIFDERLRPRFVSKDEDREDLLRELRKYKESEGLFISVREIMGISEPNQAALDTTAMAECCVQAIAMLAADTALKDVPWCVLAFGSFGAEHVHLYSDLDIAFFLDEEQADGRVAGAFEKCAQTILSELTAFSPNGQLWKTDARLRPDGRNAPLMVTLNRALSYYKEEADIWEFQSALRGRFVAGNPDVGEKALGVVREALFYRTPFDDLEKAIMDMRIRLENSTKVPRSAEFDLKRGRGGIVDVEFLVQYIQIKFGKAYPEILEAGTVDALRIIQYAELLSKDEIEWVSRHYNHLRLVQRTIRLLFETPRDFVPKDEEKRQALRVALGDYAALLDSLPTKMDKMRELLLKHCHES